MVCYGPSKGCTRCRQRKVKCDERRPGCRKCEKFKKDCPGYDRDTPAKVAFPDDTKPVSKASGPNLELSNEYSQSSSSSSASARSSPPSSVHEGSFDGTPLIWPEPNGENADLKAIPVTHQTSIHTDRSALAIQPEHFPGYFGIDSIPSGLKQDPEQESIAFFMTTFADSAYWAEGPVGDYMEPLPSMFKRAGTSSALKAAATTTAMGAISWTPGREEFRTQSLSRYVTSLNRINDALKDAKESTSDNVLLAVLLLGFYENTKSLTMQKSARDMHINGAAALVKARDPQSFHSQSSLRLYLAVRAKLLFLCIDKCDPAPFDAFLTASKGAIPDDFVPGCADRLVDLSTGIPKLRFHEAEILHERNKAKRFAAAKRLLKDAQETDAILEQWPLMVPEQFVFSSLPLLNVTSAPDVYPHTIDVYCDDAMANVWNTWRITRIHVLRMIMTCAEILDSPSLSEALSAEGQTALSMIRHLVDSVCATVPFHLGHHLERINNKAFSDYPHPPGQAKWPEGFRASGAVGGFLMMQPLAFIVKLDCIPQSQRGWIKEYLTTFLRDPRDMRTMTVAAPPSDG